MSITIRIPALWRPIVDAGHVTLQAESVMTALQTLAQCYPKLATQLFNEQQEVNEALHLFVNNEAIRFRGGLTAPLHDGDEIYIVPMLSGG